MFHHRHQILKCLITQCCHQLTVLSALSLQIAPKIYSLRKWPIAEVDAEKTTEVGTISSLAKSKKVKVEPKIPKSEDISVVKLSADKSRKVKVEPEKPLSLVTVPESEDVSIVKSSTNKSKKVKVEVEMPQSVVTVTSTSSVRSKKCKAAVVVTDENQGIPPKVAHVDKNAAIVVGQSKGKNGTKNIRQIKQTGTSVLVPKQITGSDDEELDVEEADFQRR